MDNLSIVSQPTANGTQVEAQGRRNQRHAGYAQRAGEYQISLLQPERGETVVIEHRHHLSRQRNVLTSVLAGRPNTMRRVPVLGMQPGQHHSHNAADFNGLIGYWFLAAYRRW